MLLNAEAVNKIANSYEISESSGLEWLAVPSSALLGTALLGTTSRGSALLGAWICTHATHNLYYIYIDIYWEYISYVY